MIIDYDIITMWIDKSYNRNIRNYSARFDLDRDFNYEEE